ncbi:MAG TPA: hypothetical protein VEA69_04870 [Tepidisphaeraceae bacterium]|nr:hypothetical protein [Tepidisphaeraceae bacterium]
MPANNPPSAWSKYSPIQKVGAVALFVVLMSGIAYLMFVMKDRTSDTERDAKKYISAVEEASELAKSVRDPDSARAATPKLREAVANVEKLKEAVTGSRVPGDERLRIRDMLQDARPQVDALQNEMTRINANPELRAIVAGEK